MASNQKQSVDVGEDKRKVEIDYAEEVIRGESIGKDHVSAELAPLTPEELELEKKLVKKMDWYIMPLILLVYLMNYVDRNAYPAARLQGLEEDLGMNDGQYRLGLSILFVGYCLGQLPSNMMLNYCGRPSWYLAFWIVAWGLVSSFTALVTNFWGMFACRFLLGFVEAPFFPGVLFYLSKWYTKKELNLRMAIFYSGALISGAFGTLLAAGILGGFQDNPNIRPWQALYAIEGAATVVLGVITCFVLPDFPETWKKLGPEMGALAVRRMTVDGLQSDLDKGTANSQFQGLKQAVTDPKTWIVTIMYHAIVAATGFQNFYPSLTSTLGFNRIISLLLVAPPYIFVVFASFAHSWYSDKLGNRFWFWMYPIPIAMIGCFVFMFTEGFGPRYFSLFLLNMAFVMLSTIYAWVSSSIPRPPAKRACSLAILNSIGNCASIWTPYTYTQSSSPQYRPALGIVLGLLALCAVGGVTLRFYLIVENRQLARFEDKDAALSDRDVKKLEKVSKSEGISYEAARRAHTGFRYVL